ncbi:uncharacterized protein LOC144557192 [Carex rostrata]
MNRRSLSQPLLNIHESAAFSGSDSSPLLVSSSEYQPNNELQNDHLLESKQQQQQPQYHLVDHLQPQMPPHNQQYMTTQYPCTPVSPDSGANQHQPHGVSNLAPHLACVQLSSIAHLPGRLLHVVFCFFVLSSQKNKKRKRISLSNNNFILLIEKKTIDSGIVRTSLFYKKSY